MQQDSVIWPIYIEFKPVKTSVELKTQKPGKFGILQKELIWMFWTAPVCGLAAMQKSLVLKFYRGLHLRRLYFPGYMLSFNKAS